MAVTRRCVACNLPSPFWAGSGPDLFMPQGRSRNADQASDMTKVEDGGCVLASRHTTCPAATQATVADVAVGVAGDSSRYWWQACRRSRAQDARHHRRHLQHQLPQ